MTVVCTLLVSVCISTNNETMSLLASKTVILRLVAKEYNVAI